MENQKTTFQPDADSAVMDSEIGTLLSYIDCQMEQEYFQTLESTPDLCRGLPGFLRYKRESQERIYSHQPQPQRDSPICCQFCGSRAWPPLDPGYAETREDFCCENYRELFEIVVHEKHLSMRRSEAQPNRPGGIDDPFINENNELQDKAQERGKHSFRQQQREMQRYDRVAQSSLLVSKNNVSHDKTIISFRLSNCAPKEDFWKVEEYKHVDEISGQWPCDESSVLGSVEFGLTHHQNNSSFLEKYYSNGNKFLTAFPDGSAQVFYPSGNLALIILSCKKERICIVQDDLTLCPVRALFQSNGKATCYHGKGSIWLSMDAWGGRSLDESGRRIRTWSWKDQAQTPTPLRPLFLSLNRNIGVRVLGQQLVFVSFLASGQQARFRVGSCESSKEHNTPPQPLMCKEELVLLACRVGLHMALIRLQQCQAFPSSPTHLRVRPPPFLHSLVRRLRSLSHRVQMEEPDKAFVQRCLQAYP
ncbi:glutamate-rich protein 6 isoform X1 [Megalobrama amblycephala]|uniref:glutamate-rich protein 6 isoform X1 n=1 Tax=Megalobrama amblycephala TaxID=75352 RepID=UPI002013DE9D|nr:glutamate-rich protein 6 isoform X1 [Megalobrama amblycephala]